MQETRALGCKIMRKCPTIELRPASLDQAGATAYDPRTQSVWASDGTTITNHSLGVCKTICSGTANRLLGSASVVSGLTVNDTRSHLYQLETIPGRFAIAVYDISKPTGSNCFNASKLVTSCNSSTLTTTGLATGIAYDEGRDLLYIATSEPNGKDWKHYILVADRAQPCRILCQYNVAELDKTRIATGLEFVTGTTSMLYLSNGVQHLEIAVGDPKKCQFTPGKSCTATGSFRGLAMVPGWDLQRFGKSCLPASCRPWPSRRAS